MTDRTSSINIINSKYRASSDRRSNISYTPSPNFISQHPVNVLGTGTIRNAVGSTVIRSSRVHGGVNTIRTSSLAMPPIISAVRQPEIV